MIKRGGIHLGEYDGIVVDNRDLLQSGRVRLRVPAVLGDRITDWCPSHETHADRFEVPEIGTQVTVSWKDGDISQPPQIKGIKHSVQSVPPAARNQVDTSAKGVSSFQSASDDTISEPPNPERSAYPAVKVIAENDYVLIEVDRSNGRVLLQSKRNSAHFWEWQPDGSVVMKCRKFYLQTDEGVEVQCGSSVNVAAVKDFLVKASQNLKLTALWNLQLTAVKSLIGMVKETLSFGAGKGVEVASEAKITMASKQQTYLIGQNVDTVSKGN